MSASPFETFAGGDYELALRLKGDVENDRFHQILQVTKEFWGHPFMIGAYQTPKLDAQAQSRLCSVDIHLKVATEGNLYGFARVLKSDPIPIYTHTLRYDDGAGDWFYANFPMSSLGCVFEIPHYGYRTYDEEKIWLEPFESWLASLAKDIYQRVPFAYGVIGHETEAGMKLPPQHVMPRRESFLVPENGELRLLARSPW